MMSCDEVDTIRQHAPKKKRASKRRRKKRGGFSKRMPGFKRKMREMFEEEFTRRARNAFDNSRKERENAVQEWSSDNAKDHQTIGAETRGKGEDEDEDGTRFFQIPKSPKLGGDLFCHCPFRKGDEFDVEFNALDSSVETTLRFQLFPGNISVSAV